MDWAAFLLSLQLATATTAILFVGGLPLAYWLATSRWPGRFLVEAVVTLPLVLPPTVLGFYLLMAASPGNWFGGLYEQATGRTLPFSFAGLLAGSVVCNLPFAIRPFLAAFETAPRRLMEASWCLGESSWSTFWRVTWPLCRPGVLAGLVLVFAHAMGEFGVALMLGGNIASVTRTISIAVYDDVQSLNYAAAGRTSFVLMGLSFVALVVAQWLGRRRRPA